MVSSNEFADSSLSHDDRPLVLGIGGSAGAIDALQHFFDAVPDDPGIAFVVVMHLAPEEKSHLAEVLQDHTTLPVTQVTEETAIESNHVYVVAPGHTVLVEESVLVPHKLEGPEERRSPIDQFFRSLAQAPVEPMGLVVSGAGTDGSVGLSAIVEAGGVIAAQDPSEATHASMPRSAITTNRVDFVLPVADMARRLSAQHAVLRHLHPVEKSGKVAEQEEETLSEIFKHVRSRTGHDFSEYKKSTMVRRIRRRLQVHQIASLDEYLSFLEENPSEVATLQKDLLISVTSFFRNPEAFSVLREDIIPSIGAAKGPDDQIRAWVVGCATGEEAYSLAMLLLEHAQVANVAPDQIQVFASDLDESALATARKGRYPEAIHADVPERYLGRFFQRDGAKYVVRKSVRERVLFTPHNLLRDPPFSKLDLISCRNLLIYLQRDLQRSVFDLFGYALNEDGYLFLGSSESVDASDEVFDVVSKSHRIYQRRDAPRGVPELPAMPLAPMAKTPPGPITPDLAEEPSKAALHRRMLEAYAPPSAIVDEEYSFVHLSDTAGRYLKHPGGTPNANIVDLVRPELRVKLRSALREAFTRQTTVHTDPVRVQRNGMTSSVRLVVRPGKDMPEEEGLALVLFVESDDALPTEEDEPASLGTDGEAADDARVQHLQEELEETKKELRATIEEHETSKQEMRAANEELRSMNEEYKSMTEELETSKEELQSVNEELKTVNRELEDKVDALRETNSDLQNLLVATDIGTLFLDRDLRIQRYTPQVESLFNIRSADIDRPIGDLTHHLEYSELEADAQTVLDELSPVEREVKSKDERWFIVRQHPYRTVDDRIEGVVITFVDITRRVEAEQELRRSNEELRNRTEQVQTLSVALSSAEETERKRMSQVLHDTLQQTIFAARMRIDHLLEMSTFDEKQSDLGDRAVELLDEAIQTTRTLSSELDPPVGEESLRQVFEWLSIHMQEAYGLSVALRMKGTGKRTYKNLQFLLYRLSRELLFNVVKHAGTEEASLHLIEGESRVRVVVEDEGAGFDPSKIEGEGTGLGLVSLRERINMVGGNFTIDTAPGEGTRVSVDVPLSVDEIEEEFVLQYSS